MKKILFVILTLISLSVKSQSIKIDTIINKENYISYFSFKTKTPLYVKYNLHLGGGDCSREGFRFISEFKKCQTTSDYSHSGYDQGHLANSEDFAGNCKLDNLTFNFINALPQTANLNRGIWKKDETKIRNISQTEELIIVCGGIFEDPTKTIGNGVIVPTKCWKVVYSKTQKKVVLCTVYENDDSATKIDISLEDLNYILCEKYNIDIVF